MKILDMGNVSKKTKGFYGAPFQEFGIPPFNTTWHPF